MLLLFSDSPELNEDMSRPEGMFATPDEERFRPHPVKALQKGRFWGESMDRAVCNSQGEWMEVKSHCLIERFAMSSAYSFENGRQFLGRHIFCSQIRVFS